MSHHVPGPPDYDVVMTEQVPGLNGPKMLGRHKPTAPYTLYVVQTRRHDFIFIASLYSTPTYCSLILIWICEMHILQYNKQCNKFIVHRNTIS